MNFWTRERDKSLLKGLKDGLSASQIAEELSTTRNAVIGRTHRIKGTQFPSLDARHERERLASEVYRKAQERRKKEHARIVGQMLKVIADGKSRNVAIAKARRAGATLEVIGDALGVTRERIRQIVENANWAA